MTTFISRDYNPATTGYNGSTLTYTAYAYQVSLFLNRVLGYSIAGKKGWDIDSFVQTIGISGVSNSSPRIITTSSPHGLSTGQSVYISGIVGATDANTTSTIVVTGANTFALENVNFNGSNYLSGGTVTSGLMYAFGLVSSSNGAGINFGTGVEKEVSIPSSVRIVSTGDIGRILVLKSTAFPTKNSGCFKITSVNVTDNRYIIDYRSTENPPSEIANSMDWWLYENESIASFQMNTYNYTTTSVSNATNTSPIVITSSSHNLSTGQMIDVYNVGGNTAANGTWVVTVLSNTTFSLNGSSGNGAYTSSTGTWRFANYPTTQAPVNRIILQSPHPTGWQVRICNEVSFAGMPRVSFAVGIGGNSLGDFPIGGQHTHVPQYFNVNPNLMQNYFALLPGGGITGTAGRTTIVGDDSGQFVFLYSRSTNSGTNGFVTFGIPDNEDNPSATVVERLFCYGNTGASISGTPDWRGIFLKYGNTGNVGMAFKNGKPEICTFAGWGNIEGTSNITAPTFINTAGDSPFVSSTELLPIEIWTGAVATIDALSSITTNINPPFSLNQKYNGTAPVIRNGRTNFGDFTLTTEDTTSRSVSAATNASPIQITTATHGLTTGQTVTISGVNGNTAANGTYKITVVNNTTFTLDGTTGNGAYTSGGTVRGCPRWIHLQNGIYLQWNGPTGLNL